MGRDADQEEMLPCGRSLIHLWEAWDEGVLTADPHVAGCPHCTAALEHLRALQEFVEEDPGDKEGDNRIGGFAEAGESAAEDETFDSRVEAVTGRVMDIVRLELRPGRTLPLGEPDEDAWIVEAALAKVLRRAADSLPGVRAGSCRIRPSSVAYAPDAARGAHGEAATDSAGTASGDGDRLDDTSHATGHGADRTTDPAPEYRPGIMVFQDRGPVDVYLEVAATLSWTMPELAHRVRERVTVAAIEAVGVHVGAIDVSVVDLLDDELMDTSAGADRGREEGFRW
ncbi:hypothetical protein AB0910_08540 [Streptomyces sp. NPDC047002]|uniref:hypothetical protein n=1 Tax=Streptomyces sp. NPDC047002 TaxID=3155475 RepID=UPI0034514AAC